MRKFRNIPIGIEFKTGIYDPVARVKIRRGYKIKALGSLVVNKFRKLPRDREIINQNIGPFNRMLYVKGEDY